MRSKSLGILVRMLLFGMFLIVPSSVYADAFSVTLVNFNNLQITSSAGNVTFSVWQASAFANAAQNLGGPGGFTEQTNTATSTDLALATATVSFANATGEANAVTLHQSAVSLVDLGPCNCVASSTGRATLTNNLMVTGVDGPVVVNISAQLDSVQSLLTNEFGPLSQSQISVAIFVDGFAVFSMEFPRISIGANATEFLLLSQQFAHAITVEGNTQHLVAISIQADSSSLDAIPEPATAVLLLSGLGLMTGLLKKRRQMSRR
jgi:hypothetical protein